MENKDAETKAKALNKDNFEETIKKGVTLVDFWAEWCGPCLQQMPIIYELADKMSSDEVVIAKVDLDTNQDIAVKYEVTSIPTIFIFKNGEVMKKFVGVQSFDVLKKAIEEA